MKYKALRFKKKLKLRHAFRVMCVETFIFTTHSKGLRFTRPFYWSFKHLSTTYYMFIVYVCTATLQYISNTPLSKCICKFVFYKVRKVACLSLLSSIEWIWHQDKTFWWGFIYYNILNEVKNCDVLNKTIITFLLHLKW